MLSNLYRRHISGSRILIPLSGLLSLAFVANYLVGLRAHDEPNTAVAVTGQALSDRLKTAAQFTPSAASDVVAKALAFKALLTTAQQATLEQTYTTTLARRWSNLPCGANCRNGIQLSTLNAEQLAAAVAVINAAAGTAANEGGAEFDQIRLADAYLGANGGGSGYSAGIYFLAFLNTPSNNSPWMLQFGGHHYGANIAFNQGRVVSSTPLFEALEPISFVSNGTTYTPLNQEREALAAMLASLSAEQLATAKLTQTFGDVVMSPGESNGGASSFPATKVGLSVRNLSTAQKQLVLDAMKPWVRDADDTVAANLLAIYQSELDDTYIAFTGNGVAGDASSFLITNANYARIDGPSAWIEFACQTGAVFRNQIHYHTIWRDRQRDYAKDLSLTTPLDSAAAGAVSITSAASFAAGTLAPEAIGTLFGTGLAAAAQSASSTPLPTTLGSVQVRVTDSAGTARVAPLFYVSPTQVSFQVPAGTTEGSATVAVLLNGASVGAGNFTVENVTPGLFAANANGQGVAAAIAVRIKADGTQVAEPLIQLNSSTGRYEAVPLTIGDTSEPLVLLAFGTGFRNRNANGTVTATIGGVTAEVIYAGAQGANIGLDQANIRIPTTLAGRGDVNVVLTVDGKTANTVSINIK
jgi:uncharacterized protein (TIGR03437 family)